MSERDRIVSEMIARAKTMGKGVFGFSSEKASCAELNPKKAVPENWNWIAVEGDTHWTPLPPAKEPDQGASKE